MAYIQHRGQLPTGVMDDGIAGEAPQTFWGSEAPDGDADPWVGAAIGTCYIRKNAGNVTFYLKTAANDADADWVVGGFSTNLLTQAEMDILDGATLSTAELNLLDGVNATTAEINAAADVSARYVDIGDNTTYTVLAANSGKPHTLPDLTADIVITLPSVASGLEYSFIYAGVAADAQDWQIDTGSDTNFYLGGLAHLDTDAGSGGDEVVPVGPDGNSNSKVNILVPDVGTRVNLICDGTNWILDGIVVGATAPTYADQ